jgi:ferredoxin-type protein NapH
MLKHDRVRYFGFVMLAFVALASLPTLTAVYCEWLCPFRMITEFHVVTRFVTVVMFIMLILFFLTFVIVLPFVTKKRMQCMTFCPFGAMQSILGKISFYKVKIDTDKCSQCMECVHVCPTMSMSEESIRSKKGKPLMTCTMCGECITMCPQKAIDYSFCGLKKPRGGLIARLREKCSARDTIGRKIVFELVRTFEEIVSPRALFIFAAFTFGMIIASGFGKGTIHRILNLFINGSFLLQ